MEREASEVRAWEDTAMISTSELGPEDRNPPLLMKRRNLIHPGSSIMYPYPLQEDLSSRCSDKEWRVVHLENDYLRLSVLPQIGGRLISVWDKCANAEALHRNNVLRYVRIGIRGAFVSGGIEWNFPNGHTVTTSSEIDCAIRENGDGSKTILIGDIERVSRMRWSVGITLFREYAFFETETRLYNRTSLPNRYWFWANSAAPVSGGMQYISTSSRVSDLRRVLSFPVNDGVDLSWDRNHPEPQDMFGLNHRHDFGAWYNHDLARGLVNAADRTESRGLKFFTWGNADDGAIWQARLTDSDGPYAEMQSGRFSTQRIWEMLPPYTEESWKEAWYPVTRIGSPVHATRETALSLKTAGAGGVCHLGVHVNRAQKAARIIVSADSCVLWEKQADIYPGTPLVEEIPSCDSDQWKSDIEVKIQDSSGKLLLGCVMKRSGEPELPVISPPHIEPKPRGARPEDLWLEARDCEKLGELDEAASRYELAIKLEAGFSPAQVGLGALEMRKGQWESAGRRFAEVLGRDPANDEARFYLASCLMSQGRLPGAVEELKLLLRSRTFRAGSSFLLGGLYLGQGSLLKAVNQLEKCLGEFPWFLDAACFLACAQRKLGSPGEAEKHVTAVLRRDPLNFPALAEAFFLAEESGGTTAIHAREALARALRGEHQSYLELSADYSRFGLFQEAFDVLSLCPVSSAIVHYHLGCLATELGMADAASHFRRGREADPLHVFPHRLESEKVLRQAIALFPDDARALYYLGNLLCSKDRPEEAIDCWQKALNGWGGYSVLHRNLGRAYWKARRDPDRAVSEYRAALACEPLDYKLYLELEKILRTCGREDERRELLKTIPGALMENDLIAERVAACAADDGDFEQSLRIIEKTFFFPWEVYKGVRFLHVDAWVGRGMQLFSEGRYDEAVQCLRHVMEYPRNIGVGEPFSKANAEAWFRIGVVQEKAGDAAAARESWKRAAEEPRPVQDALSYYKARGLQKLGRTEEASAALAELREHAEGCIRKSEGDAAENHFLAGLAHKGRGESAKARTCFEAARAACAYHRRARWELEGIPGADRKLTQGI